MILAVRSPLTAAPFAPIAGLLASPRPNSMPPWLIANAPSAKLVVAGTRKQH
jgi:hypothetical protein